MEKSILYTRIRTEVNNYISRRVEISEQVFFSQYQTIKRIMKFKNRDLSGTKLNEDLSYNYYFDIISPRADSEVKNLTFDTKDIVVFSSNPTQDFAAVFILNAKVLDWMEANGEDQKLKDAVLEYVENGNVAFKRTATGYDLIDPLNTYPTNTQAKTIDDSDLIERHEMTASELKSMTTWDQKQVDLTIKNCGNKFFSATESSTKIVTGMNKYEIFEYTGEVSEEEFNEINNLPPGDKNVSFLAKVIVSGLQFIGTGEKYTLFAEKLPSKLSDHYIYAHRGSYKGRFWRVGMFETLFDHQVRANEIGNDIAAGLGWAAKTIFKSKDRQIMQNIKADMDNGDVIFTDDLQQVPVRMEAVDQLIADWNRLMMDADTLSNSNAMSRGVPPRIGQSFRSANLANDNAIKMFVFLRRTFTLPYQRVFREWLLPIYVKQLKGEAIFRLTGDEQMMDKFREIYVNSWYIQNLVQIGPHTQSDMEAIKAEKLQEVQKIDPVIDNAPEIWKDVMSRLYITITGENYKIDENVQDMTQLLALERDPNRINFLLNAIYAIKGIPIPPVTPQPTPDQLQMMQQGQQSGQGGQTEQQPEQAQQPQQQQRPQQQSRVAASKITATH